MIWCVFHYHRLPRRTYILQSLNYFYFKWWKTTKKEQMDITQDRAISLLVTLHESHLNLFLGLVFLLLLYIHLEITCGCASRPWTEVCQGHLGSSFQWSSTLCSMLAIWDFGDILYSHPGCFGGEKWALLYFLTRILSWLGSHLCPVSLASFRADTLKKSKKWTIDDKKKRWQEIKEKNGCVPFW